MSRFFVISALLFGFVCCKSDTLAPFKDGDTFYVRLTASADGNDFTIIPRTDFSYGCDADLVYRFMRNQNTIVIDFLGADKTNDACPNSFAVGRTQLVQGLKNSVTIEVRAKKRIDRYFLTRVSEQLWSVQSLESNFSSVFFSNF
jgi:hypothetical protein